MEENKTSEFKVGYSPNKGGVFRIEIDSEIMSVNQFSTAIQALESAEDFDQVEIYLQTVGGSLNATDAVVHAIRKCQAHVHIIASGGCHSAGTMILLEADSIELSEGFNACCHGGQDGSYGTVSEYRAKSSFDAEFRTKQFKSIYEGFLTSEEIDDMLDGKDIWLDAEGWIERAQARKDYFLSLVEDDPKEVKKLKPVVK